VPKKQSDNKFKLARQMGIAITIPMVLVSGPLVGWFFGSWLDGKFGTKPWCLIVLLVLGTVAGARQTIHMIKDISRDDDD
jgi:F0F1-type ATP synthase assembly protein I